MQPFAGLHHPGIDQLFVDLPIAANSSVLGIAPASDRVVAFTITMNRIMLSIWN
jgi:hypothetical protein